MPIFTITLKNQTLTFMTNNEVFSPSALDAGTAAMLSVVSFSPDDKVLDLGCGYGPVGILAAKLTAPERVTMCDISENAVLLSRQNAARNGFAPDKPDASPGAPHILLSDGLSAITDCDYTKILSNPPYHTDFSVAKGFIEQGFRHLAPGGVMYMVTKRRDWYKNKLISVFGGVHIDEIDGYYVFTAEKRAAKPHRAPSPAQQPEKKSGKLSKKLARKQTRKRHA